MPLVECMSTGAGLAKRFIARNKLFPVIVSYYKTLVPLFFRSVLGNVDPLVYLRVYGFYLFHSFFNSIYMKSCVFIIIFSIYDFLLNLF